MAVEQDAPKPPDAVYVRQRWIPIRVRDWVMQCNAILLEYGAVHGRETYQRKTQARYKSRKLKKLMVELRLHEGWQLVEHTEKTADGWVWSLEYIPPMEVR
jgi:hypothetical protein